MIVKRRSPKFIGSPEWVAKDVARYGIGGVYIRFTDKPTGIRVEGVLHESVLLRDLAHRVNQLS